MYSGTFGPKFVPNDGLSHLVENGPSLISPRLKPPCSYQTHPLARHSENIE